ncbi:MAG TPA: WS/DGAT domain-containing protein [Burkholderiales bacterium]|nr:WS/DGAT domain-containing protein [Burkholderiales bacterium]
MEGPREFARLNPFQEVMACWETAHPYNAGQVVRLDGRADVPALEAAIQTACQQAGVGTLVLDRHRRRYGYDRAGSIQLEVIVPGDSPADTLRRALTESLNATFPDGPHHPIRWSILEDPGTGSSLLITVWHHLAADEMSMRLLLRRVLNQYYGTPHPDDARPLTVLPRALGSRHRYLSLIAALGRIIRLRLAVRKAYRFKEVKARGEGTNVHLASLPTGLARQLGTLCRSRGVTVNDLILAALGKVLARATAQARAHASKRNLALGAAVSLRSAAPEALAQSFGVFLGHWVTLLRRPDAALPALLRQITVQTRAEKIAQRAAASQLGYSLLALMSRWGSIRHDGQWYEKVYRISGSVSNVRASTEWFGHAGQHIREYYLVSPPGPAMPLVVAAATLDDQLNLCLVAREAALSAADAGTLLDQLRAELNAIAGQGLPPA